jgi:hypothetical protein
MPRHDLTPEQEQEIREFAAEQSRRIGEAAEETTQKMLGFARRCGFEPFLKGKASQRALVAQHKRQPVIPAQQALINEYRGKIGSPQLMCSIPLFGHNGRHRYCPNQPTEVVPIDWTVWRLG